MKSKASNIETSCDDNKNMALFTRRKKNQTDLLNHEDLYSYLAYITSNFIEISEKKGEEIGLDAFGSPLTDEGFFGVQKELLFNYLVNPFHEKNLNGLNIKFPLSRKKAQKLIVKLGPSWIFSITQIYKSKPHSQPSKDLNATLAFVSLAVVSSIVTVLDKKGEFLEYNSEEMAEARRKAFIVMKEIDDSVV